MFWVVHYLAFQEAFVSRFSPLPIKLITMATAKTSRVPVRDRILAAASELFYREGVQNVGIDRIIAESGVAKMSLYNHFKSKDALIAAWLEQQDESWRTCFYVQVEALATEPSDRLLAIFDVLKDWFEQPDFRGCAFINSTVELVHSDHPGYQVALAHNRATYAFILNLVNAAQLSNPEALAQQILVLMEGAIIVAMIQRSSEAAFQARQATATLIAASQPAVK